ncbi:MAG: protein-disulfide isomerase [Motiliproteus sp.]|jgi:protein-disulfide isomerase
MNDLFWKGLLIASFGLSATSLYIITQPDQTLEAHIKRTKDLPIAMSDIEVVMLVDERLQVLEKKSGKATLDTLLEQYALAPETGTEKRLYGNLDARITLREFSDLECPWCKKMHPELKQVVDDSQGVIKWEFIHFPLDMHNPVAAYQAMAVECVAGDYDNRTAWAFLHTLFDQTAGNGKGADISGIARSLGLNASRLDNCIASAPHRAVINDNRSSGKQNGVTGTPAIQLVDYKTGRTAMIKGYVEPQRLLQMIQQFLRG